MEEVVYVFVFDDIKTPTSFQVYLEAKPSAGNVLKRGAFLDCDMNLSKQGHKDFPGSAVWKSSGASDDEKYSLVQICGQDGEKIEPAYSLFKEHQKSQGPMYYREIQDME